MTSGPDFATKNHRRQTEVEYQQEAVSGTNPLKYTHIQTRILIPTIGSSTPAVIK